MSTRYGPLGRSVPPDFAHVDKYPLRALAAVDQPTRVPVVIGVGWYTTADNPILDRTDGAYWIGRQGGIGTVRGGHAVCLEPRRARRDLIGWWRFYNQGTEGACEGFAHARMLSILYRSRFDGFGIYDAARVIDGDPNEEGTTNRSALEALRTQGACVRKGLAARDAGTDRPIDPLHGVAAYRWALTADEVLAALGTPELDYVTLLNSWGTIYPRRVRMPAVMLDRLLAEQGEAGVVTPR